MDTIAVCARIVSTDDCELRGAIFIHGDFKFTEAFDPESAWWVPLQEDDSDVGVHFWQMVNAILQLRSIDPVNDAPALHHGCCAERERKRKSKWNGSWRNASGRRARDCARYLGVGVCEPTKESLTFDDEAEQRTTPITFGHGWRHSRSCRSIPKRAQRSMFSADDAVSKLEKGCKSVPGLISFRGSPQG